MLSPLARAPHRAVALCRVSTTCCWPQKWPTHTHFRTNLALAYLLVQFFEIAPETCSRDAIEGNRMCVATTTERDDDDGTTFEIWRRSRERRKKVACCCCETANSVTFRRRRLTVAGAAVPRERGRRKKSARILFSFGRAVLEGG